MEYRWFDETSEVTTLHWEWTLLRLVGMQRLAFRQNLKDMPTNQLCVKDEARKNEMENRAWTFIPKRFILTRLAWDRLAWKKRSSLAGISGDTKKVKLKIFSGSRQCTSTCPGPLNFPPAACRSSTRGRLAGCTTPSMSGGFFKELSK